MAIAGGLMAIAGGLFLIHAARYARRPVKAEHGLTPLYVEQAGARFDVMNWTMPFVRIATFEDFVVLSCVTQEIVLRRGDVRRIEEERHWGSQGVRVDHTRIDIPAILLWPRDSARLQAALKKSLLAEELRSAPRDVRLAESERQAAAVDRPMSLLGGARLHWRSFAPAWLFPILFLYGGLASDSVGRQSWVFWLVAAPLFYWSFFRATRPLRHGELGYWPCMFWAMVVPFLIWVAAVFFRLLLLDILREHQWAV